MPVDQAGIYVQACDFLKEPTVAPGQLGSKLAIKLDGCFQRLARDLMADYPWRCFAMLRRLVAVTDTVMTHPFYAFAYPKGPDWLYTRYLTPDGSEIGRLSEGWIDEGGYIYSSRDTLYLSYVSETYLEKIAFWPPSFATAVAAIMAEECAGPITNSRGDVQDNSARAKEMIERAWSADAMGQPFKRRQPGRWQNSRFSRFSGVSRTGEI